MPQVVIHAYLEFADEATRDEAVRLTGPIQWKTRTEEPGFLKKAADEAHGLLADWQRFKREGGAI